MVAISEKRQIILVYREIVERLSPIVSQASSERINERYKRASFQA